jgi:hypothetical protein
MPRGSKTKYSIKQKRQAEHIEKSYEKRGASKKTAEKHAWQTVHKQSGAGDKSGGGRKTGSSAKKTALRDSGKRAAKSRKLGSRRTLRMPSKQASKS